MKKILIGGAAIVATLLTPITASAGIYADDATRCIVKSTSESDRVTLVKWIFAGMSLHPAIREFASISAEQRADLDKQISVIVTNLLTQSCRKEAVEALRYEGTGFMEASFRALGEVAMGGLMTDKDVSAGMEAWIRNLDAKKITDLGLEAGRALPAPASK